MSGIYKGYNPIFESLQREVFEQETKSNPELIARTIYDTLVNIILVGSDESIKTPDGFKVFIDKLLQVSSIDGLRQEFTKKVDEYAIKDKAQEAAYQQTRTYLNTLFDQLKQSVGEDAKSFKKILDDMNSYGGTTISALQANKAQLQQNESLLSKYLAEQGGQAGDSTSITGGEPNTEDIKTSNKFLQYSKNALDSATSFAGETSAAMSNKAYANNADIQRFSEQAQKLLDQARKIQPIGGNKGLFGSGKVPTASGNLKRADFKVQVQNILTEIVRQREEFNKLKYRIGNVPTPQQTIVVCPVGQAYDPNQQKCVSLVAQDTNVHGAETTDQNRKKKKKKTGDDNVVTTTDCAFPIQVGSIKCDVVVEVQDALMKLGPCVEDLIKKAGGADGKYGKVTAKLANIYYAYLTKSSSFSATGELTQDMHDKIVGGQRVIQTIDAPAKPVKDSLDYTKVLESKIFEAEYNEGTAVVSFDSFSKIINEAEVSSAKAPTSGGGDPHLNKPSMADAVCSTYKDDKIIQDVIVDPNPKKEEDKPKAEWQGLKPAPTGIYVISYDESSGEAALEIAEVAVGTTAVVLTGGAALAYFAPAALTAAAGGTIAAGALATGTTVAVATGSAALASLSIGAVAAAPVAIGAGAVAGLGDSWFGGRTNVAITVANGFISRASMLKLVRGSVNTIDGFVSRKDITAVMATLCVLKGAWTCNKERTAAVSAWADFKERYAKSEEQSFESEVAEIGSTLKRDPQGFPDFDAADLSEGDSVDAADALTLIKEAIDRLNTNETKLAENIKDITETEIEAANAGAKMAKKSGDGETSKKADAKAAPAADTPKP
jgi:hypothetical protein